VYPAVWALALLAPLSLSDGAAVLRAVTTGSSIAGFDVRYKDSSANLQQDRVHVLLESWPCMCTAVPQKAQSNDSRF
jgi:hypothetical protein